MGFRTTAVLGTLFIALLAFLYFYESELSKERRRAREEEKSVLSIDKEAVTRIQILWADTVLVAVKEGKDWQILEPIRFEGDNGNFDGLVTIASEIDRERVIAESTAVENGEVNIAEFGLADPGVVVELHQEGKDPDTVYVGDRTPVEGYFYLRRSGNPEILMSSGWRKDFFQKGLFYLRDKQILPFRVLEDVQRIEFVLQGHVIEAVKQGESWRLEQPLVDRADDGAVKGLLNRVRSGRILEFVDERGEDLASYGLERPWARISLQEGDEKKTLILGDSTASNGNTRFYGKYLPRAPIFLVDKSLVGQLIASSAGLRHKQIFAFNPEGVDRVSLVYPDSTVNCEIDATSNEWVVQSPPSRLVLRSNVESLIRRASAMKAKGFVSENLDDSRKYGLDQPTVVAKFWKGTELRRRITVAAGDAVIYATMDSRPQVVVVYDNALDELKLELIQKRTGSE